MREELLHFFNRNKEIAEKIIAKVEDTQQLRKELQEVKKLARERAKAITFRIPQLKDCKIHFDKAKGKGKGSMVFITRRPVRRRLDRELPRREHAGRSSCSKASRSTSGTSSATSFTRTTRCTTSCAALDIEDNLEGLRYDKVILATDADVDGMHIRNLLITYFFRFFEQLVHDGHLFVLETPLFRVRNKEKTIYCYSEAERDAAAKKLGGKSRRSRASKAWAKSRPNEFKQFIGKEMRLSQVEYAPKPDAAQHPRLSTWARTRPSARITSWRIWSCRWRND